MSTNRLKNGITTKQKRFSIDDAFEEETDEAIKVYGTAMNGGAGDCNGVKMENGRWIGFYCYSTIFLLFFYLVVVDV